MELTELKEFLELAADTLEEFRGLLDVKTLKKTIDDLEQSTYVNTFWEHQETAQKTIALLKIHRQKLSRFNLLFEQYENLEISFELLKIGETVEKLEESIDQFKTDLALFETDLYLSKNYDQFNAIIEIHPGAGGTESQDWAMMLYRMISRYATLQEFTLELNDYLEGAEAGIKSVTCTIIGPYAFGKLKSESGVHRLVRLSPFDSSGRRHTSFASINVIPEIDDTIEIELLDQDLKIDTYRSSGAGGQSVNTTDSAVRITHLPTKMTVTCQNERSQIKNRERALKILKGKLYQLELDKQKDALNILRNINQSNAFGSQIRSYVMHPYAMVKDHRTDAETSNVQKVLDGELTLFVQAYLKQQSK